MIAGATSINTGSNQNSLRASETPRVTACCTLQRIGDPQWTWQRSFVIEDVRTLKSDDGTSA
jgi:hypothetical protein